MRVHEGNGLMDDDLGERAPKQQAGLDALAKDIFGRTQTDARADGICVKCGSGKMKPEDFKDDLSRREAKITQFCQSCQDNFEAYFDEEDE